MIHWIDRYGEAIERDLHETYQVDLLDFFRGVHSWRKAYNLIVGLPKSSAYRQAQMDDPLVAEYVLKQPVTAGRPRPELREWSPEVALLTEIGDRMGEIVAAVLHGPSKKQPPPRKPLPRPITGIERARAKMAAQHHKDVVDEVKAAQVRWAAKHGKAVPDGE